MLLGITLKLTVLTACLCVALILAATLSGARMTAQVLAYTAQPAGVVDERYVYLLDVGRGISQRVTHPRGNDHNPQWSPDGTRLLFHSDRAGDSRNGLPNSEVYVLDAFGGAVVNLSNHDANIDINPHWLPDGEQIAFVSSRENHSPQNHSFVVETRWFVVDATGGEPQPTLRHLDNPRGITWSPDGARVAFEGRVSGSDARDIFITNVDGGEVRALSVTPADESVPAWSPDGGRIAFKREAASGEYVVVMDVETGERLSAVRVVDATRLVWSPDGTRLAFSAARSGRYDVHVVELDSGRVHNVSDSPFNDTTPVWSPDGTQLAFVSQRSGNGDLYLVNADGTGLRNLTHSPTVEQSPDWRPYP